MKIVILDAYEEPAELDWSGLQEFGEVRLCTGVPQNDAAVIAETIGDAEVLVPNKVTIDPAVMDACPTLKFIAVTSTGYNQVDVDYARKKGIAVANVPSYSTDAVAQFTFALLLEICSRVGSYNKAVHEGAWENGWESHFWDCPLTELAGKTIGIIGFGNIGQQVGRIAKTMGMKVLAYNHSQCDVGREIAEYVDLDTMLAQADVVSLHIPLFPETEQIINRDTVAKMKKGVILLNTSRGGLVEEQAVADALASGHISAAGVDVVSTEPIKGDNPLLHAPNCIITPHVAWATQACRQRVVDCTVKNIRGYANGALVNIVNGL